MADDEAGIAAAGFGVEGHWPVLKRHRIRWAECDMYAHVNHAAYLTLCEDLRVAHWVSLGGRFEPGEAGPVVARLEARYLRPLGFDDEVALTLRPGAMRRTSFTQEYAVWRGGLAFSCKAVLVLVRHGTGERVPITPEARRLLKEQGAVEEG
ncbi:MAG: acyl-CoA thioesterase [Acetobacteraceae bacterium]|nr:acyl-CoA thioesterase [Acetobacteraceae bacterium]